MVSRAAVARQRFRSTNRASTPAPIGGWNTRDDLANMPANDAEVFDNWLPDSNTVKFRKGYVQHASSVGSGNVDTIASFVTTAGANQLLACGGGQIYDVTSGTATSRGSGYASDRWDTASFNNQLVFVNGADFPQVYDGSTVSAASFSGGSVSYDKFFTAQVFKNRVFYAASNELAFWYTELFASTGAVTKFPLVGISERGGHVVAIGTWTVDGGSGPDDFLAIFTSEGEVLVYQGSDPGTDFSIVGRFYVGRVVDSRAVASIYGKLFVATERDYIYLPDQFITQGGGRDSKLSGAARDAAASYGSIDGWQTHYSPNEGLMVINVPTGPSTSVQHVINVKTGAATRFTGINARVWAEFQGSLYWGGTNGTVNKYAGTSDGGAAIVCVARTSPSPLRTNSEKIVTAYRPRLLSNGTFSSVTGLAYDYGKREFLQSITLSAPGGSTLPLYWPFSWSDEDVTRDEWQRGAGRGTYVQLYLQATSTIDVSWLGTDYISEPGGILR